MGLSEAIKTLVEQYTAILFASISGAAIHIAVAWQNPIMALRHFFIAVMAGALFGPGVYSAIEAITPFSGEAIKTGSIGAVALGGVYCAEGVVLFWKRWSQAPSFLPWRKP